MMLYASNIPVFDYLGITKLHEQGIKGQGIKICSRESTTSKHGHKVFDIIQQIVPDAEIIVKQHYYSLNQPIDIYTTSLFSGADNKEVNKEKSKELYSKDILLVCAAGNESYESCTGLSKQDVWTSVGACSYKNSKAKRLSYSSVTDNLDFMSITNLETSLGTFTGTSCAAPVFASMCALVQCYFLNTTGKKLTNEELLKFIKKNCIDMDEEGHDSKTGHGLFIIPKLEVNMFKDYTEYEKAIDYLTEKGEMDSPQRWKERIKKDNDVDLMWFCVKWANAVKNKS